MILPIIKLKTILDSLLTWVVAEYNSKTDENDTWLYDTFNGNIQGNFNVYTEIKGIILRGQKDPNKLETRRMFDTSRAALPTIHIHMPSEGGGGFNSIGSGYGNDMDAVTTGVTPNEVTNYSAHFGRSFESQYELIITGSSTDEVLAIYELLKALFLAGASTLQHQFDVFEYSGKELMANPDLIPYQIFFRAFNIKIRYEQVVRSVESYSKINSIYLAGKLVGIPASEPIPEPGPIYVFRHNDLTGREATNSHPISAITGLNESLQSIIDAIPTTLAELDEDTNYRTVTDIEKGIWNRKQDALGATPEFANTQITTLDSVANGGIIPNAEETWLGSAAKSVLSYLQKLVSKVYAINSRVAVLENKVILEVTLAVDTTNVLLTLPTSEQDVLITYSSASGMYTDNANVFYKINNQTGLNYYICAATRFSGMLCYVGRHAFFGKIRLTRIGGKIYAFMDAQTIWGNISTQTVANRIMTGYLDIPQAGIDSIEFLGDFKAGTNFKVTKQLW